MTRTLLRDLPLAPRPALLGGTMGSPVGSSSPAADSSGRQWLESPIV